MSKRQNNDPTTGVDSLGKALRRNLSFRRLSAHITRGRDVWRKDGWEAALREIGFRFKLATHGEVWKYRVKIPLARELKQQSRTVFPSMPLLSVVVPLYNTPRKYFHQLLKCIVGQSYSNWQLVLVDASEQKMEYVAKLAQKNTRIRYKRLEENWGISGNTNAGLEEATGDFITLLDHDDVLAKNALFEVVKAINETGADLLYSDEIVLDANLKKLGEYHFKPDFAPDTLRGCNYITHLCVFSHQLLEEAGGGEKTEFDGAQDYDLILRLSEKAKRVHHIQKVLYFWRRHESSTAQDISQKPYALEAGANALRSHLEREELEGEVEAQKKHPGAYRIKYAIYKQPMVSVLIPNKDHTDDLQRCLDSLYKNAGWENMEVLVLENNSTDLATEAFYQEAEEKYPSLQVLRYRGGFNFAAICNFGAARSKGEHLLLLNNDMEIISCDFIREMLSYSQRPEVGAVGAMLYYPDETVQHAGLIIGIGGTAGVSHKGHKKGDGGDMFRLSTVQNMSAVTGAALMVKRRLYEAAGGMDEANFAVAFNDVDFCLRLREQGLWNVFTPFAQAYHYESKSRGYDVEGAAKARFDKEAAAFKQRHAKILKKGDPFYNPHFTLEYENFGYV